MNAKSNFLITGLYLSETGQLARKPDSLFFLSSVFIIKKRCVSLWRNRIPLLPKATICYAERQGQIRTPTHEYQEYHEEEPRYTSSDSPRADTERPVVWNKWPERKASVFFSKYGLYKHYDIGVELMAKSYDKLLIPDNSIIYCDPPYRGKKKYNIDSIFNHDRFYDWCVKMSQKGHKVFVSENDMSLPFREVWSMPLKNRLALNTTINTTERLYSNLTWMKKDSNLTL